jgi:hypothetical protein
MTTAAYAVPRPFLARSSSLRRMETGGLSDEDLLEQVATERDSEAFAVLYRRYSRAIYSLVQRVLRDHHAADDVSQEARARHRVGLALCHRPERRRRCRPRARAAGRRRGA